MAYEAKEVDIRNTVNTKLREFWALADDYKNSIMYDEAIPDQMLDMADDILQARDVVMQGDFSASFKERFAESANKVVARLKEENIEIADAPVTRSTGKVTYRPTISKKFDL